MTGMAGKERNGGLMMDRHVTSTAARSASPDLGGQVPWAKRPGGYRFNRPATRSLHDLRRRASAQNIDSGIVVGVDAETALDALELRLILARAGVHGSAGRTFLRCIRGVNLNKRPATLFQLVGKEGFQSPPSLQKNGSIQSGLGCPSLSLSCDGHVRYAKVFKNNGVVTARQAVADLVEPVRACPSQPRHGFAQVTQSLLPTCGANLASGHTAAAVAGKSFQAADRFRQVESLAIAQGNSFHDAAINGYRARGSRSNTLNARAFNRGEPSDAIEANGHAAWLSSHLSTGSELDPSHVRYPQLHPLSVEPGKADLRPLHAEAVIAPAFPRAGEPSPAGKESVERSVKITQCLSQGGRGHRADPIHLSPQLRNLFALPDVVEGSACRCAVLAPKVAPLLQSQIVDVTHRSDGLTQHQFLFGSGRQPEAKRTVGHGHSVARTMNMEKSR